MTVAIPSRGIPLPGFGAPAVGFDTPFEMLEACHERVQRTQRWAVARSALLALAGGSITQFSAEQLAALDAFAAGYAEHIRTEEEWVYPAARAAMDAGTLQAMGRDMRQRRGATQ